MVTGNWYDGRSSHGRLVRLEVSEGTLVLDFGDAGSAGGTEGAIVRWPLEAIAISPRLGSTPRILRLPDGARVEAPDSETLQGWFGGGASRVEGFADWLERRRLAIAVAALVAVAATVAFFRFGVPVAARELAERMPAAVERHASDQVATLLERMHFQPTRLPEKRRLALERGFREMVAGTPREQQLRVGFVSAPGIGANAFALPDGRIYVTDQLVELAESDREVLAVLAHEAGHHAHRHGMRLALESSSVLVLAGILLGDVSGSSLAVSLPAALLSNGYSRGHEREADAYALELMKQRGIPPAAFAAIMRRLSGQVPEGLDEGVIGYMSSHPPTPERIEAAERAAQE